MLRSLSEASAWHAFSSRINSLLYQTIELNYMSSKFQSAFFPWFCPGSLVCDLSASPICLGCWFHHVHNSMHWFHLVIAENYWSSPTMQNIYIFFSLFRLILASFLEFSRMIFLIAAIEPFPKTGHHFCVCLLSNVMHSVVLESSLHFAIIFWNLLHCSPSLSPTHSTA